MIFQRKQIIDEKGHIRTTNFWSIEVDYNNLSELESLNNKITAQINTIKSRLDGLKNSKKEKFESCCNIWESDISHLYKDLLLDSSPIYYVYAHCEPNKIAIKKNGITTWAATIGFENIPFYIGKGKGNRAFDLKRNETHRKIKEKFKIFEQDIKIKIIREGLTELEALCLESKLIDIFGIMGKGGRLVNLDEGVNPDERRKIYQKDLINLSKFYENSLKVEV
jgi:hypothetical protein